jgi:hypothetical protein
MGGTSITNERTDAGMMLLILNAKTIVYSGSHDLVQIINFMQLLHSH